MLALMRTRHTKQAAEVVLTVPIDEAIKVGEAVRSVMELAGHTVRRCNAEGDELYTFDEVFPDAHPGLILRGFRALEDMTQDDLAGRLGIHQTRVSDMESGKRSISVKMARQLGELFGTSHKTFL